MKQKYTYEIWNGKRCVGQYHSEELIRGDRLSIPAIIRLKSGKIKATTFPMIYRLAGTNGIELTLRKVIDVRKKGQRQIDILCGVR